MTPIVRAPSKASGPRQSVGQRVLAQLHKHDPPTTIGKLEVAGSVPSSAHGASDVRSRTQQPGFRDTGRLFRGYLSCLVKYISDYGDFASIDADPIAFIFRFAMTAHAECSAAPTFPKEQFGKSDI